MGAGSSSSRKDDAGSLAKRYALQLKTAAKLKQRLADTATSDDDSWRLAAWVAGLDGVAGAVASGLLSGEPASVNELGFARGLPCSAEAMHERLLQGGTLEKLSRCLADALAQLQQQETATVEELQDKFVHDGKAFTLQLGGLDKFYGGLEAIVGAPNPKVLEGMESDHCAMPDSTEPFDMPNRKATSTSIIEWRFVASPEKGADGLGKKFAPYPKPENSRIPLPFDSFQVELGQRNEKLAEMKQPKLVQEEFLGARLYTSPVPPARPRSDPLHTCTSPSLSFVALPCDLIPSAAPTPMQMYLKYNAVLRGVQFEFARPAYEALCQGNRYTTTLHAINSAIIKLSKLTAAGKVYRGVSGGVLPESCRKPNAHGVKGGVECGFMSTRCAAQPCALLAVLCSRRL